MEGSRFIVPVVPALAVLAVVIIPRIKLRDLQVYAIGGIIAFHIVGTVWFAKFGSVSTPIWEVSQVEQTDLPIERYSWFARPNRTHLRDMPVVERAWLGHRATTAGGGRQAGCHERSGRIRPLSTRSARTTGMSSSSTGGASLRRTSPTARSRAR